MEYIPIIDYRGIIKYETIGELIHKLKQRVAAAGLPVGVYKRILLIMIESLENIMKHSVIPSEADHDDYMPSLLVLRKENEIEIHSSNPINPSEISSLKKRIDYLNSLDMQSLKNVYKDTITDGVFTNTGGAGLGLIEIVKVSANAIGYEFIPVNEKIAVYKQYVRIKAN